MDIFSAGCVIAEVFTETPIFNLSQLFKYRKGEYDPSIGYLNNIHDVDVRDMVIHMIQLQPESRYSADEYLNFWRRRAFPEYFYTFLYQYMGSITDPSGGRAAVDPESISFGEADERIYKVYHDFDKIAYALGHKDGSQKWASASALIHASSQQLPVQIDVTRGSLDITISQTQADEDGSLLFLTLVVSSLRHTARANARIRACDLMLVFAERVTDEAKFDRILPYIVNLLNDSNDGVKIAALRSLTRLLASIRTVSLVNAYAFPEYIKPRLQQFTGGPGPRVSSVARATYASCLASLALSSVKIVDAVQAMHVNVSIFSEDTFTEGGRATSLAYENSFDQAKADLLDIFETQTKALLTDRQSSVRRALLGSVPSLCVFFGNARAGDVILSHLNTYLNDKDWLLKCTFFRTMVGVATFVGGASFEDFVLPLMLQSLIDPEEYVTREVLSALADIAKLGLFKKTKMLEMLDLSGRYMIHPNPWIREAAVHYTVASLEYLSPADRHCLVTPVLEQYLRLPILDYSGSSLLDALRAPLNRAKFELALLWATKAKSSTFWMPKSHQQGFLSTPPRLSLKTNPSQESKKKLLGSSVLTEEDEQWLRKFREIGLQRDDEFKIVALKEHILRVAPLHTALRHTEVSPGLDIVLPLKDLHITPQTVFFEPEAVESRRQTQNQSSQESGRKPSVNDISHHTITDALLDASTTEADSVERSKLSKSVSGQETERPSLYHLITPTHGEASDGLISPRSTAPMSEASVAQEANRPVNKRATESDAVTKVLTEQDELITGRIDPKSDKLPPPRKTSDLKRPGTTYLLQSQELPKTSAKAATSAANAVGTLEGPLRRHVPSANERWVQTSKILKATHASSPGIIHSYTGNDPAVTKLLGSLASTSYPLDVLEFGPVVTPATQRPAHSKVGGLESNHTWRPRCVLTAVFGEHTGPINRVLASADHAFFVTGSDDGTVKVWDTLRLERNLTTRSRCTFVHCREARVTALSFVEHTHTFISAASDGSIKVVKVDYSRIGDTPRYGRPRQLREYQLSEGEYAVWLDHAKIESASLLLAATNLSRILAIDLKKMTVLYALDNPLHHGCPTCFCVDHNQGWLVVGSSQGLLDLWDLRFRLRLKAWALAGRTPIRRILVSPFHPGERKVLLTGGTTHADITVWDLENGGCCEIFRAGISRGSDKDGVKAHRFDGNDANAEEEVLDRVVTNYESDVSKGLTSGTGIPAIAIGLLDPLDKSGQKRNGMLVTGGPDHKVRLWNYRSPSDSLVIAGLQAQEPQPRYVSLSPTTSLTLHTERLLPPNAVDKDLGSRSRRSGDRQPRNSIINQEQLALLKSHLDDITDVCLLESPVPMTVSVDRLGCIYIFQ